MLIFKLTTFSLSLSSPLNLGPEEYHCIECQNGYGLVGNTRPNRCVILNLVCHVSCNTCFGTSYTQCLTCKNATQVPIEGTCASSAPAFWNKLVQVQYDWSISEPLSLYYGFSYDLNYIYFRFKGYVTNMLNGWLYLQFGTTGVNEGTARHLFRFRLKGSAPLYRKRTKISRLRIQNLLRFQEMLAFQFAQSIMPMINFFCARVRLAGSGWGTLN